MSGPVVDHSDVRAVIKRFRPSISRVGGLVCPLQHAPFALNTCRNLQINRVGGLKVASCRRLVVAGDTVLNNVPVSVVRRVGARATIVAARAMRPPKLRRCGSRIAVATGALALEFAAMTSVATKPLHVWVIHDRFVVRRGGRNLKDVLV